MTAWRGPLTVENVQTGDGRVIAAGATEWDEGVQPLAYRIAGDQHVDTITDAPQVGTIDRMWREGDLIMGEGVIDDDNPAGAELVRRLESGTASHGSRQGVSIDPDNWEMEVWAEETEDDESGLLMVASGSGALVAAAGDPDETDGRVLLMEDGSGKVVTRMTRLRVRGATAVAVPAFSGAYIELVGDAAPDSDEDVTDDPVAADEESEDDAVRADATLVELPVEKPSVDMFYRPEPGLDSDDADLLIPQGDDGFAVPLQIDEDRHVYGHAARWGQCHIGYPTTCVTAPPSPSGYAHFHRGEVWCADSERPVSTGPVTMGTDHAAASAFANEAVDHYAHTGLAWADVRLHDGDFGIWMSGRVRPEITDEQIDVLRAGGVSGDWRSIPHGTGPLEMIGLLAVNNPGFGITREPVPAIVASAHIENGLQTSLVAAGVVSRRCPDCDNQDLTLADIMSALKRLDRRVDLRTRHLIGPAAEHALTRIRT